MPHLALFLPDLHAGGAERIMLQLAGLFAERGHKVDLVLARAEGPLLDDVPSGVAVVHLGANSRIPGRCGLGIASLRTLYCYIRDRQPNALLSTLTGANLVAGLSIRFNTGCKTRWIAREACSIKNIQNSVYRSLVKLLYRNSDGVVADSERLREELVRKLGLPFNLVHAIPNPLDVQELQSRAHPAPSHPWYNYRNEQVITACGRLEKQKGFDDLIRAFADVRRTHRSRLLILGEGSLRRRLETLISELSLDEYVHLAGFVANPAPYIRHSDLFVLSSRWEGFPNALLEAMALGVPVVATDCDTGPREILEQGRYGALCQVGDVASLAQAIRSALTSAGDVTGLFTRASAFNPQDIASAYERTLLPNTSNK